MVETPKWSFTKYKYESGRFVKDILSPLPNIFNYGFIEGSLAEDGDPKDVLILGKSLPQGTRIEINILGYVKFYDKDRRDYKHISSLSGKISRLDLLKIAVFFKFYALFKTIHSFIAEKSWHNFRYGGIILNNTQ